MAYEEAIAECREEQQRQRPGLYGRDLGRLKSSFSSGSGSGDKKRDGGALNVRPLGAVGAPGGGATMKDDESSAGLPPQLPWLDWLKVRLIS